MRYRPAFPGIGPYLEAIMPAAVMAAAVGVALNGTVLLIAALADAHDFPTLGQLTFGAIPVAFVLLVAAIAATFAAVFYITLFGLPLALVLGRWLHHPFALALAVLDAAVAAAFVVAGSWLDLLSGTGFEAGPFAMLCAFALPAGVFYRRQVLAFRETAEFLA